MKEQSLTPLRDDVISKSFDFITKNGYDMKRHISLSENTLIAIMNETSYFNTFDSGEPQTIIGMEIRFDNGMKYGELIIGGEAVDANNKEDMFSLHKEMGDVAEELR